MNQAASRVPDTLFDKSAPPPIPSFSLPPSIPKAPIPKASLVAPVSSPKPLKKRLLKKRS